jgi:hypothetical protein
VEVGAELFDRSAAAGAGGDRARQSGQGHGAVVPGHVFCQKALARRVASEARPQRNRQELKLVAQNGMIAGEVARRPGVTLAELRDCLQATHGVSANLGLMHDTLTRRGLTHKNRAGHQTGIGPRSPGSAPIGATGIAP